MTNCSKVDNIHVENHQVYLLATFLDSSIYNSHYGEID
jgi:hypothetical protein